MHEYRLLKNTITGEYKIQRNFPITEPYKSDGKWRDDFTHVWCGNIRTEEKVEAWCEDVSVKDRFSKTFKSVDKGKYIIQEPDNRFIAYTTYDKLSEKGIKLYVDQLRIWAKKNYDDCVKGKEKENAWEVVK